MLLVKSSGAARRAAAAGLLFGLAILSGCGGSGKLDVYPVKGKLTLDGEPFGPTSILLAPTTPPSLNDPNSTHSAAGKVDASGNITFSTYEPGDGVPAGEYRVVVGMDFADPPKPFPQIYRDTVKSPLIVKVEPAPDGNVEIKMDSKAGPMVPKMSMRGAGPDLGAAASDVSGVGVKKEGE